MSNVSKCFFCANKKDYDAKFGYFGCDYSGQECKGYSMFEPKVKPKPSNADRIRAMSDSELSRWLAAMRHNWECIPKAPLGECGKMPCSECWLNWLQKEAPEE